MHLALGMGVQNGPIVIFSRAHLMYLYVSFTYFGGRVEKWVCGELTITLCNVLLQNGNGKKFLHFEMHCM